MEFHNGIPQWNSTMEFHNGIPQWNLQVLLVFYFLNCLKYREIGISDERHRISVGEDLGEFDQVPGEIQAVHVCDDARQRSTGHSLEVIMLQLYDTQFGGVGAGPHVDLREVVQLVVVHPEHVEFGEPMEGAGAARKLAHPNVQHHEIVEAVEDVASVDGSDEVIAAQ